MTRITAFSLTVLLLSVVSSSARADNGIPSNTLGEMGLSGLEVISDNDALTVRGMGGDWNHAPRGSIAKAWGGSEAEIEIDSHGDFEAESENGYFAMGKHFAKGGSHSWAKIVKQKTLIDSIGHGYTHRKVMTKSLYLGSGGHSWSKAL